MLSFTLKIVEIYTLFGIVSKIYKDNYKHDYGLSVFFLFITPIKFSDQFQIR